MVKDSSDGDVAGASQPLSSHKPEEFNKSCVLSLARHASWLREKQRTSSKKPAQARPFTCSRLRTSSVVPHPSNSLRTNQILPRFVTTLWLACFDGKQPAEPNVPRNFNATCCPRRHLSKARRLQADLTNVWEISVPPPPQAHAQLFFYRARTPVSNLKQASSLLGSLVRVHLFRPKTGSKAARSRAKRKNNQTSRQASKQANKPSSQQALAAQAQ